MHSEADTYRHWLCDVHAISWIAGGVVGASLIAGGIPGILVAHYQPGHLDFSDVLNTVETAGMLGATVYVVEHLVRRLASRWQFSLAELLIAFTAACLLASIVADEYSRYLRWVQWLGETGHDVDPWPSFLGGTWFIGAPWLLGLGCLCVGLVKATIVGVPWVVRTVVWWMTRHWEQKDDPNAKDEP